MLKRCARSIAVLAGFACIATSAQAVPCGDDFNTWLGAFQREAVAKGISQQTVSSALADVMPDPKVLSLDRNQRVFTQSFEEFSQNRIAARLQKAQRMMIQYGSTLGRIEEQFGVPAEIVVAIWGLE